MRSLDVGDLDGFPATMRALSPMDAGFANSETRETPMHVGGLLLLRPPEGAGPDYVRELYAGFVSTKEFRPPFDVKLVHPPERLGFPHWTTDEDLDIEYHLRHSALPRPGRYRELFVLVSRLHGTLLDRSRPLWEYHLIEGLETGQIALYSKLHHALLDGVAAMRLLQSSLSEDPQARVPNPWSKEAARPRREAPRVAVGSPLQAVADATKNQIANVSGAVRALVKAFGARQRTSNERMALPFEAPRSPLNVRVTGARRFVAQSYSLARVDAARSVLGATVNDIVLAMCSSALRRYLEEYGGGVPERPLTSMVPVSVRPSDGEEFGNAVSVAFVNLATHLADPAERLKVIQTSIRDGRSLIQELSFAEVTLYTALLAAPALTPALLGLGALLPATNVVISNIPGPSKTMYWNGARLDGMYPVSIVFHGLAVNITITSYAGSLDFGIVACRRSVPRVQRIIDFLEEGLVEIEELAARRRGATGD
jgi:diacylglycerol O-acyltransferase / wax synthase